MKEPSKNSELSVLVPSSQTTIPIMLPSSERPVSKLTHPPTHLLSVSVSLLGFPTSKLLLGLAFAARCLCDATVASCANVCL
jgi:hypothetical protein